MRFVPDLKKLSVLTARIKRLKMRIGFVPTMGALHAGHFSLIDKARKENDIVVVSIFVNPAQFGPGEDLKKYPRSLKKDIESCRKLGVDFVFLPDVKDMYPEGYSTFVNVENLSGVLCGASRPGHFRGVATVVAKLLNIIHPDTLYLGQKDAQQAIIISRMVKDLNFPVKVRVLSTVRQKDGLALSSRNAYLNKKEKSGAVILFKALQLAEVLISNGQRNSDRIISRMKQLIQRNRQAKIDYIAIVNPVNLEKIKRIEPGCLIALAVKIGKARLIDNTVIGCA
ncbi:MAG: pantoate--beta-alanine ligase [Candidatus Omnitrophica bacterium]|nr:pantoate--beta-alanine ligase [Candidatus Omnitrophota bacterium]